MAIEKAPVILTREDAVQKLIELATMHLSLRECHQLAVAEAFSRPVQDQFRNRRARNAK